MKRIFKFLFRILKSKLFIGLVAGVVLVLLIRTGNAVTSTDDFCESCHVHPHATASWKLSTHFGNQSGVVVHCVECHLPPDGIDYIVEKTRLGVRDAWGALTKDPEDFDWEAKSTLEHARTHTFKEACLRCHQNLFTIGLSREGDEAHLHYSENADKIRCINCHLHVGHFDKNAGHAADFGMTAAADAEIYDAPAKVEGFEDFTETVPGTSVAFDMVAVSGGTFTMGSPESEPQRGEDEGPAVTVELSPFWIGRTEVTWSEYEAFYRATAAEGRSSDLGHAEAAVAGAEEVDAISGATPPWGNPGQGWGRGDRPAITMTHHAAMTYCRWLSQATGKKYRLPTEAEWEFACRGGTDTPYFFEGDPDDVSGAGFWNSIFGADTDLIDKHVVYRENSGGKTGMPADVAPNPLGLLNMPGNVAEFCLDWYAPEAYATYARASGTVHDPRGPSSGTERVIRGGSFKSEAGKVRSAARDFTRTDAWLMTDPQIPKSIWWYSDCVDVGFRVVCEVEPGDAMDNK